MNFRSSRPRRTWFAIPASCMLALSVSCASFSSFPATAAEPAADPYETAYLEASLSLAGREYAKAVERLTPLRGDKDAPPEILVLLSEALLRAGNEEEGRKVVDEAIERYPGYVPALRMRSTISRLRGKYDASIADLETALTIEPKNSEMLDELGLLRYRTIQKRIEEKGRDVALQELLDIYTRLSATRQGSQKIPTLLIMSGIYSEMGQNDKSIEAANQAVTLRPQNVRSQLGLAEAYAKAKKPKDALRAYRQALLIEPENTAIRSKVAEMISAEGKAGGLLAFYEELAQSFPKLKEIQKAYSDELVKAKEWKKAADQNRKALELWPDDPDAKSALVVSLFMLGEEKEAMKLAESLISSKNFAAKDMTNLAQMLSRAGKVEAATALYKKVAESDPANDQILLALSGAQIESGKQQDAIETLKKLVDRRPDLFLAAAMLGQLYSEAGRFDDAHALYDRVEKSLAPENAVELQVRKADLYRREGKLDQSRAVLEQLVAKGEGVPEVAVRMLVEMYANDGAFDKAHETVDKFIKTAKADQITQWQNVKAWLYWKGKRYKDAVAILEGLHAAEPANFEVIEFLSDNYAQMGDFDKAQGLLKASEAVLPDESKDNLLLLRARLYSKEKKNDMAVQTVEELLSRNRDDEKILMVAGQYYHDAGRENDAERVLRRAIELNPGDSEAYNALGYFFAEAGVKLDEALKLVQKALELNPKAGHILDSLGWVYYRQGNYDKAIQTLESAVERMSRAPDAVIFEHLGDAYAKGGREEKARQSYGQALKLDPESESVKKKLGQN